MHGAPVSVLHLAVFINYTSVGDGVPKNVMLDRLDIFSLQCT